MTNNKYQQIDQYPNLGPPEILPDGFKDIKFLPGQQNPAPKILWGNKFEPGHKECMPLEWQLDRVKKVASAMNHAADHAQNILREMIEIANHQERQLDQAKIDYENQRQTMISIASRHNEEQQARIQEMQALKNENKRLRDALLLLASGDNSDQDFIRSALSGAWSASMEDRKLISAKRVEFK